MFLCQRMLDSDNNPNKATKQRSNQQKYRAKTDQQQQQQQNTENMETNRYDMKRNQDSQHVKDFKLK